MNKQELKAEIARYGDTCTRLAQALGCAPQTLSKKINNNGASFNMGEIDIIRKRYNLSFDRLGSIFLQIKCLTRHERRKRCQGFHLTRFGIRKPTSSDG